MLNIDCSPNDYCPVLAHLKLTSLADHRHVDYLTFILNILNGKIDSPTLSSRINFCIPARLTRYSVPLHVRRSCFNYANNQPLRRRTQITNLDPSFFFMSFYYIIMLFNNTFTLGLFIVIIIID